ncbi:hypothetical protein [Paenibacillus planticolens]|uniref:hypothetical protein n=1 Tax=Paenibacillus planticolens TaxID=2654976 RepID=UPI001490CF1E|nr:hypothetical protein [Paenibacillus planticolens]
MKEDAKREQKVYTRPMVLSQQPVRFETAQSSNQGYDNLNHPGHNGSEDSSGNGKDK